MAIDVDMHFTLLTCIHLETYDTIPTYTVRPKQQYGNIRTRDSHSKQPDRNDALTNVQLHASAYLLHHNLYWRHPVVFDSQ